MLSVKRLHQRCNHISERWQQKRAAACGFRFGGGGRGERGGREWIIWVLDPIRTCGVV